MGEMEPLPENIEGRKETVHVVRHEVHWGYLALGVAAILLIIVLFDPLDARSSSDDEDSTLME